MGVGGRHSLERWLFLRTAMATLVMAAAISLLMLATEATPRDQLLLVLSIQYLVVGTGYWMARRGVTISRVQSCELAFDVVIITACVHLTGGATSLFSLLYFFPILMAAFELRRRGAMLMSSWAAGCFLGYALLSAMGVVHPFTVAYRVGAVGSQTLLQGYFVGALLLVVGYLAGELSARVESKTKLLETQSEQLDRARRETQSILYNMNSGILVLDSKGAIRRINPAAERIFGTGVADMDGRAIKDVLGNANPVLVGTLLDALADGSTGERMEINIVRPDGVTVPLGLSVSLQRGPQGEPQGLIAVFQDLTSVVQMRDRIRKNDRLAAMGELSASIAHEIRNPLASIRGSVEMLTGELDLDGENGRLMELVAKESARLNRIIENFLEYARLKPIAPRNCHLHDLLSELEALVSNRDDLRQSKVNLTACPLDVVLNLDEELMMQVFQNLSINGLESMGGSGTLRIVSALGFNDGVHEVAVRFIDDGEGLDETALARLFEPFFTTKKQGTGLGLPLANRIVANHDGRIEAHNIDGGGAEFTVTLPLAGIWHESRLETTPAVIDDLLRSYQRSVDETPVAH